MSSKSTPPAIDELEIELWRELIVKRCGMAFNESQSRFLTQRLWERMRARDIATYREYRNFVTFNPKGDGEWADLLELITINETSFFRHMPSYTALADVVLPDVMSEKSKQGRTDLALWSTACSAGQEAYSLAIAAMRRLDSPAWQLRVTGTDISPKMVEKARRGVYRSFEVRNLPEQYRAFLVRGEDKRGTFYEVAERVKGHVAFSTLNLMDEGTWAVPAQDVVFCQNVLLYFRPEHRLAVVERLCRRLNPGGYLFLAPAEVVGLRLPGIRQVAAEDALVYQNFGDQGLGARTR
jgi:chemotaxis methyl-accepting protein methylase